MLRASVLLAHGILPHQIPAALIPRVPFLQPECDGQRQGAAFQPLPVVVLGEMQVGISACDSAHGRALIYDQAVYLLHLCPIRDIYMACNPRLFHPLFCYVLTHGLPPFMDTGKARVSAAPCLTPWAFPFHCSLLLTTGQHTQQFGVLLLGQFAGSEKMSILLSSPSVWPLSIMRLRVRYSIFFHLLLC